MTSRAKWTLAVIVIAILGTWVRLRTRAVSPSLVDGSIGTGRDEDAPDLMTPPTADDPSRVESQADLSPSPDSTDPGIPVREVEVVDVCGELLAEAEVARGRGGAREVLGRTGSRGRLRVTGEASSIDDWSVVWGGEEVPIAEFGWVQGVAGRARITVQFADQIWGHVDRDDFGADLGSMVCAWKKGTDAPLDAIRDRTHPWMAEVDGAGRYSFCGLEADQDYFLVAAGEGRASDLVVQGTSGVPKATRIETHVVYGARVKLVEPDGRPVRVHPGVAPFGGFGFTQLETYPNHMRAELPQMTMLGVLAEDLPIAPEIRSPGNFLWLQCGPWNDLSPGFAFDYPGYEPAEVRVEVAPILDGVCERRCTLHPTADGFGSLALHITPAPTYPRGLPNHALFPHLEVELVPEDSGRSIRIPASGEVDSPWILEPVPAGAYFVRFRAAHQHLRWPAAPRDPRAWVSVAPGQRSELRLDWPELGAVDVRLSRGGKPFEGRATLSLFKATEREDGSEGASWSGGIIRFEGPPYCFNFVPPGDYRVHVMSPAVADERFLEIRLPDSRILEPSFELR